MSDRAKWPSKDPKDHLDYSFDWTNLVDPPSSPTGDTIISVEWIVPEPLVKTDEGIGGMITVVWLEGGEVEQSYPVECQIETAQGRRFNRGVDLVVVDL